MEYNVFFLADLHIGHKNILFHQPNRIEGMSLKDKKDIEGHDAYIVNMWLSQTKENDHIYFSLSYLCPDLLVAAQRPGKITLYFEFRRLGNQLCRRARSAQLVLLQRFLVTERPVDHFGFFVVVRN